MKKKTPIVYEKFSLKYNTDSFKKLLNYLSLGEIIGQDFLSEKGLEEKFSAEVIVVKNPEDFIESETEDFSSYYKVGKNSVYYEKKYAGLNLKLAITDINSNHVKFYCNKNYKKFVAVKVDGLYPLGIHITDIFLLKFIDAGNLVVHGASIFNEGRNTGFSLVAPPDTGKTYTTYKFLETDGYKFLGEDLSMWDSNDNSLYCMPFTSTWGHRFSFSKFSLSSIPVIGLFFASDKKSVYDLFGESKVQKKSKSEIIYLLEKSTDENRVDEIKKSEVDETIRKIKVIQRNEYSYYKNPLMLAFDYANNLDLNSVIQKEDKLIEDYFSKNKIFIVKGTDYSKFYELIKEHQGNL